MHWILNICSVVYSLPSGMWWKYHTQSMQQKGRPNRIKAFLCHSPTSRWGLPELIPEPFIFSCNNTMPPHFDLGLSNSQENSSTKINLFWQFCFSSNSDTPCRVTWSSHQLTRATPRTHLINIINKQFH